MGLESISKIIKVQLPAYLKKLPLPETISGFARLTGNERQRWCTSGCSVKMIPELIGDEFSPITLSLACKRKLSHSGSLEAGESNVTLVKFQGLTATSSQQ